MKNLQKVQATKKEVEALHETAFAAAGYTAVVGTNGGHGTVEAARIIYRETWRNSLAVLDDRYGTLRINRVLKVLKLNRSGYHD